MLVLCHCSQSTWEEKEHVPHNIYSEYSNRERRATGEALPSRHKRSLGSVNACPLHMRADPLLYSYFKNTKNNRDIVSTSGIQNMAVTS